MTPKRTYLNGFLTGLLLFLAANLLSAHLRSDCGLPAVFGADFCADDIVRAGFPLTFFEEGGFAARSIFSLPHLFLDALTGILFGLLGGFGARGLKKRLAL